MKIYWWIGIILFLVAFLAIVDCICFGLFSFNSHRIFHPERYGVILPAIQHTAMDQETIQKGGKIASKKKVMIASLGRDISEIFPMAVKRLEAIGSLFGDYEVVIFENDSKDGSRELFKSWCRANSKVNLLDCEDLGYKDCKFNAKEAYASGALSLDRMTRMAFFRNRYVDHFCNKSDADYLLVYDFDLDGGVSLAGILHSIGCEDRWDAIFAKGLARLPPFGLGTVTYDGLAYVSKGSGGRCHSPLGTVPRFIEQNCLPTEGLVEVDSAFNGLAIYKRKCVLDAKYHSINETLNCEHIGFHHDMIKHGHDKLFINNLMELEAGPQGPSNKIMTTWNLLFA